jgi:SNF2 family DNA or RNA helicase
VSEIIEQVAAFGEKAIVFSYFLRPLRLLQTALDERGLGGRSQLFEGALNSADRSAMLDRFKNDSSIVCLLASSRVASEGLTLTEANHVCFLNQWWNPSSNAQARDRVVRIGQKKLVHVYVFTCEDTVEQRLEEILKQKGDTYQKVVERLGEGEQGQDTESLARALLTSEKSKLS